MQTVKVTASSSVLRSVKWDPETMARARSRANWLKANYLKGTLR